MAGTGNDEEILYGNLEMRYPDTAMAYKTFDISDSSETFSGDGKGTLPAAVNMSTTTTRICSFPPAGADNMHSNV